MEDFIYIIFFVIYIIFAILKKVGEKQAIDKNKNAGPAEKKPGPVKDIFARLEEIKRQQEMAAKQTQREANAANKMDRPAPYAGRSEQKTVPAYQPEPVPVQSEKLNEYAAQQDFSYDELESLEEPITPLPSLEEIYFDEEVESDFEQETMESHSWSSGVLQDTNLQKAFVWKEIFDKPLALRR